MRCSNMMIALLASLAIAAPLDETDAIIEERDPKNGSGGQPKGGNPSKQSAAPAPAASKSSLQNPPAKTSQAAVSSKKTAGPSSENPSATKPMSTKPPASSSVSTPSDRLTAASSAGSNLAKASSPSSLTSSGVKSLHDIEKPSAATGVTTSSSVMRSITSSASIPTLSPTTFATSRTLPTSPTGACSSSTVNPAANKPRKHDKRAPPNQNQQCGSDPPKDITLDCTGMEDICEVNCYAILCANMPYELQRHGQGAQSAANRNQNKAGSQVFAGDPDTLRKKGLKRKGDTYISAEEFPWASTTAGGDSAVIAGVPLAQQHVQKDALPKAWGAVGLSPTGKFTIKQFANAKGPYCKAFNQSPKSACPKVTGPDSWAGYVFSFGHVKVGGVNQFVAVENGG